MRVARCLVWVGIYTVLTAGSMAQVHCGRAGAQIEVIQNGTTTGWISLTSSSNDHFTDDRLGDYLVFRRYDIDVKDPSAIGATFFYEPSELLAEETTLRLFRQNPDRSWTEQRAVQDRDRHCLIVGRFPKAGTYGLGYRFDRTEYTLRVRVIERDTGKPLRGAKVQISTKPHVPNRGCFFYPVTDEHGIVTIRLPRVKYYISPSVSGYFPWHEGPEQPFLLDGPVTRTITMFSGFTVRGRVLDEEGKPVPNAKVRNQTIGADGTFVLTGLSNRVQDIWAELLTPWPRSHWDENGGISWTDQRMLGLGHALLDPAKGEVEIRMRPVGRLVPKSPPECSSPPWGMPPEQGCLVRLVSPRGSFFLSLDEFVKNEGTWLPAGDYRVTVTTPKTTIDLGTVTMRGATDTNLDMKSVFPERKRWKFACAPAWSSNVPIPPLAYLDWRLPNAWRLAKRLMKEGR